MSDHRLTKLKQRNIVGADDVLIPPRAEYSALWPGTVVLMKISLHTFSRGQFMAEILVDLPNLL